ncbi:protein kinase domain-containing protein [Catellatospora methionotrophica]|uniref:protein kinase domain-containing protein n=1 Tax=Catellatospora methionotrophica TaxID=121620 RepID=UPI0031D3161A
MTLELVRELGRGGQGAVYEVAGGRHAVKILSGRHAAETDGWVERIQAIRRLPLEGLPVARPLETLAAPLVGYVMELIVGMVPLSQMCRVPSGASAVEHYRDTGGLRQRLKVLASAAETLARLHALGLVYQDPSPNNLFISDSADTAQVWLIDCDNLSYATMQRGSVFTPRYHAPELRHGGLHRPDSLSDAFAFAVLAFETLTFDHPFVGDVVYESEEDEEAAVLDGIHVFVDHPKDASNRSSRGIQSRWLVLDEALALAFQATFVDGLTRRDRRPGLGHWRTLLRAAASRTVSCAACRMSSYFDAEEQSCPWCDELPRPATLHTRSYLDLRGDPDDGADETPDRAPYVERCRVVLSDGEEVELAREAVLGAVAQAEQSMFQLRWEQGRLKIVNLSGGSVELVSPDGSKIHTLLADKVADLRADGTAPVWSIRIGTAGRADRWLCFDVVPEGRP